MANEKNLIPLNERTPEERKEIAKKGAIATNKIKKEKKNMKEMLKMCLEMQNSDGITYQQLATLGLIRGAIEGNAKNYQTIIQMLGETPEELLGNNTKMATIQLEITDHSDLEKIMYEEKDN